MNVKEAITARATALAALIVFVALPFSGCERRNAKPVPGTLRFSLQTEPPSLDWSIATDHSSIQVLDNIMEGLTRFDEDLVPRPGLAESWDVSEDGSVYTFHLRENAKWTDGVPVTADHFVYSWRRLTDPDTAGEYAYFLYMVKNAEAINTGEIEDLSKLGVRALDDHTLEVELERSVVFFPMITTFICTFPMRRDIVEKHGDDWTEPGNIETCGPYRLAEWRHEYRMKLERNDGYYGERAGLDRIVFYMVTEQSTALSLYQTGDVDALDVLPPPAIPSYIGKPDYYNYPYFSIYYYGFNTTKPPVDNPKVRAALAHAIDRSKLPDILKGNQIPYTAVIPAGMEGSDPGLGRAFDPARARALLKEAGYEDPSGLPPITVAYNTLEMHKLIAEFVQQQWIENLGITVELRNMEWKVFLKELQHDPPHVWRLGWILDYPDPDAIMTVWLSNGGNNHTRWKSEEYDRLVLEAAVERDRERRLELYARAQRMLCHDATAVIPLYSYTKNSLVRPWVKDFPQNGQDRLILHHTRIMAEGGE